MRSRCLAALVAVTPLAGSGSAALCDPAADPPEYYAIPLVTTRNLPGTGLAAGVAEVSFVPSPFGVSLAPDGSYRYRVDLTFERANPPEGGVLTAWLATRELDKVRRLGPLARDPADDRLWSAAGQVAWNKFIVIVTFEPSDDPGAARWSGPVVARGMSRSGMMHTMAGHGAFQQENCAAWGYDG